MNDPGPTPIDLRNAASILAALHTVCSHDLPNQMVSLHSLLHLLEMEELDRLSTDGREYLHRLLHVAEKTATLVDFLKESVRLVAYEPKRNRIHLRELLDELRLESRTYFDGPATWTLELGAATITSDESLLLLAFAGIVKGLAGPAKVAIVRWDARSDEGTVVLQAAMRFAAPTASPWTDPRLDLVLARARLQRLGVAVTPLTASPETAGVRLRFPAEAP
jgi:hypothetical protein